MRMRSLSHFHVPRRAGRWRPHALHGGGDILFGVALLALMLLLTHMVAIATDTIARLFAW